MDCLTNAVMVEILFLWLAGPGRNQTRRGWFRGANGGRRGDDGWPGSRARRSAGVHGGILGADERPGGGVAGQTLCGIFKARDYCVVTPFEVPGGPLLSNVCLIRDDVPYRGKQRCGEIRGPLYYTDFPYRGVP